MTHLSLTSRSGCVSAAQTSQPARNVCKCPTDLAHNLLASSHEDAAGMQDPDGSKLPKERGPFAPSHSAIWTAVAALLGPQGSRLMQPAAMTAVLNRFPDLLDMAVQEASTLGPAARQAISSLRGVLACIGNEVAFLLLQPFQQHIPATNSCKTDAALVPDQVCFTKLLCHPWNSHVCAGD